MRRFSRVLTIAALALTTLTAASLPGVAQPAKKSSKPPVKPIKKTGPVVLGTTQLPGDFGQFGTTYTIGQREPLNFTLRSAEYSVTPVTIGRNTWVPKVDEKVLLLHYTVHNPNPRELDVNWWSLRFTAVDKRDTNNEMIQAVGREGTTESVGMRLKPAQKLDMYVAILVPAEGVVPKLIVEREKGAPVIRYDLREKVTPLAAGVADPADSTGATARAEVPAQAGNWYATGAFDVRLDAIGEEAGALLRREPGQGKRFVTAVFTIKNRTTQPQRYYWSDFLPELRDTDGEKVPYLQAIAKATRDEAAQGDLAPGEEARVRFFFPLPEGVGGKSLKLSEGRIIDARNARSFVFDLASVPPAPSAAN